MSWPGHAQAELSNPLTVSNGWTDLKFGTIAIDPAAGPQTVSIGVGNVVTCPPTYVCSGSPVVGSINVTGAPKYILRCSALSGSIATLDNGSGDTIIFYPKIWTGTETHTMTLSGSGTLGFGIIGSIDLTGNEPAGNYTTRQGSGSGYQVTVNY
ncbi:MAG: DUF4402 domain-containing protein [Alphaproteobacteria bacterium]|nr:DUF4402 domain-containing protein [Alphaproteobacteria bacterium]MBN2780084.1 DUF4402 domain-containing protein [Alphaproteobacteria bacterium]